MTIFDKNSSGSNQKKSSKLQPRFLVTYIILTAAALFIAYYYSDSRNIQKTFSLFVPGWESTQNSEPSVSPEDSPDQASVPAAVSSVATAVSASSASAAGSGGQSLTAGPNSSISFKMTAVGDILLGRGVGNTLRYNQLDFTYPFQKVKDILRTGDVVFGNLEQSISDRGNPFTDKIILRSVPDSITGIKYAGFNLLNLANNHIVDYGEEALEDTLHTLKSSNIQFAGAGMDLDQATTPAVFEVNGKKIGFLGYTDMWEYYFSRSNGNRRFVAEKDVPGVAPLLHDEILKDVKKLKDRVDFIIVSLHWGVEDSFVVESEQIRFAHQLIDNGVDLILGHHPHQVQGIEIYKRKMIAYSLGNFLFDQYEPENQEGLILQLEFMDRQLQKLEAISTRTINMAQVVPQNGETALSILERQKELSEKLGAKCTIKDERLIYQTE